MAKSKKPAVPYLLISSEQGLEAAINHYVTASLTLLKKQTKQAKELAELKAAHGKENAALELEVTGLESGIQLFCTTHRAALFPDEDKAKSKQFPNATVGFRLNPHSVGKIVSKDTWDRIAERLDGLEWAEKFVRSVLEVDKAEILKCRADLSAEQLAQAGIAIEQGETFFIEPETSLLEAARKPVDADLAPTPKGSEVAA